MEKIGVNSSEFSYLKRVQMKRKLSQMLRGTFFFFLNVCEYVC